MIFFDNLLELLLEAAPWLVIGLALGGLMKALIPTAFLQRHLTGQGLGAISKAAILGAPLPLCSCGVIPAALGLRKAGASKPATAAFLVSTPETGIDSISITYALMGPFMAVVRPITALVSAVVSGILVAFFDPEDTPVTAPKTGAEHSHGKEKNSGCDASSEQSVDAEANSCCATDKPSEASCCESSSPQPATPRMNESWVAKAWGGIRYAFTNLLDDIILWLAVGMLFAALTKTFLPPEFLAQWGKGIGAMVIMLLAGIPMYICATASTPVAAGLMLAGVSPGVALVLLMTGPATNISTLGVISKELGQRSMWLYLLGVSVTAIISGLIVDAWVDSHQLNITEQLHAGHESVPHWLQWATLLLLLLTIFRNVPSLLKNRISGLLTSN